MNPFTFFTRRPENELVVVVEASIPEARKLVARCTDAGIGAVLGGKECCSSGGCAPKAAVLVPRGDVPRVHEMLQNDWHESVAREGGVDHELLARVRAAAADPSGEPHCPACGFVGPLVRGACADCGLQLG